MSRLWILFLYVLMGGMAQAQEGETEPAADAFDVGPSTGALMEDFSSVKRYLEPFVYEGMAEKDPFSQIGDQSPLVPGSFYGPFLPLQSYRLESLKVKGLFWNTKKPQALIQDPTGDVHRVGIKDYVGENFGYIASIREKEVVIIQTLEEDGQRYSTTKILFLKEPRSRP